MVERVAEAVESFLGAPEAPIGVLPVKTGNRRGDWDLVIPTPLVELLLQSAGRRVDELVTGNRAALAAREQAT